MKRVWAFALSTGCVVIGFLILSFGLVEPSLARTPYHFSTAHGSKLYFKELLLKVEINRQEMPGVSLILQDKKGRLFVSQRDLMQWNMLVPPLVPALYKGQAYLPLDDILGITYRLNIQQMSLSLEAKAELFKTNEYVLPETVLKPVRPSALGGYLNYDLNIPPIDNGFQVNGLFGLGVFGSSGVVNTDFIANSSDFTKEALFNYQDVLTKTNRVIRLNTTWTLDNPEKMLSVRVGDSITQPGMWGNSLGFGGLQVSTNFATQPRFITNPLPTIAGQAVLPSLVDLYINNALVYQRDVPPGPFDINALPVVTGGGEISLVSRDLLGREQVVVVPYYASANLLKPGLNDYSFEMGFIRNNFGITSNDYGKFAVVGTMRQGITEKFTSEFHAAVERRSQAAGLGGTFLVGTLGIVDGSVAISHSDHGWGALLEVGLERSSNRFNFGADAIYTTSSFQQLGQTVLNPPPTLQGTIFMGFPVSKRDSVGVSVVSQVNRVFPSVTLLSANYTRPLGRNWNIILSGLTNLGGARTQGVFLTLTRRFGTTNTATVNANSQNGANQAGFQYNHSSAARTGLDYYVSGLPGDDGNIQGGANMAYEFGDYSVQVANQNKRTSYTGNASGSIAYMAGQWRFTRRITNSFGVVQVPGFEGIGVYVDNQLVAHTNNQGYAFIPDLRAYDDNRISIDPAALPMSAHVKQTVLHAVPYYHSGVFMSFDVHPDQDALFNLVLPDGSNLPAGALVWKTGNKERFPVAYDGQVYVMGLRQGDNPLQAEWDGHHCQFNLNYPQTENPLPNLGRIVCHEP